MSEQPESRENSAPASPSSDDRADTGSRSGQDAGRAGPKGRPAEIGGRKGPDPTRYGDWEKNGRCIDF